MNENKIRGTRTDNKQFKVLLNNEELAIVDFLKEYHEMNNCQIIRYLLSKEYNEITTLYKGDY